MRRDSIHITVCRDTKRAIAQILKKQRYFVEVMENIRSVSGRTYVQKPEQEDAIEHLLKGGDILAV